MSHNADLILALDVGTSSCKGAVYARDGRLMAEASESYTVQRPAQMWAEQRPEDWWTAAMAVCQTLVGQVNAARIAGVGLSGQVPTMELIDADGHALGPAITWQDRRAEAEAVWLREQATREQFRDWLGLDLPIDAGWPPARMLWWQRNQPDMVAKATRVLMAKEFVLRRLTEREASDAWSAKGLVHLLTHEAPADFYALLGISPNLAPEILPPFEVAGGVTDAAAGQTGLRAGTPVVVGLSDALSGMVGAGAFQSESVAFDLTGTSDIVGCSGRDAVTGLLHIPASVSGTHAILYGPTQSGGDSLAWLAEWMDTSIDALVEAADATKAGQSDIIFLPYLQGERAPLWDTSARGAFIGLMRHHRRGDAARAVMEGVALAARHILDLCSVAEGSTVRIAGGGARSPLWNQIRADVLQMDVEIVEQSNVATLGAAMLAAIGAGLYADLSDAGAMIRIETRFRPNWTLKDHYAKIYARYRALYPAIKHLPSS